MLNVEHRLIAKIVLTGDFNSVEKLKIDEGFFFSSECKQAFNYLKKYYHGERTFGHIPGTQLFRDTFPSFPILDDVDDTIPILCQEVRKRLLNAQIHRLKERIELENNTDPLLALETLKESSIHLITQHEQDDDLLLSASAKKLRDRYQQSKENKGVTGIPWKWDPLNVSTRGIHTEDMVVIYGLPKTGKTSFAIAQAVHSYECFNARVLFYSFEMRTEDMTAMAACFLAGVPYPDFLNGTLSPRDEALIFDRMDKLAEEEANSTLGGGKRRAWMSSSSSGLEKPGIATLRAKIREFQPTLVVIDAAYLMSIGKGAIDSSDWKYLTKVSRLINNLSKETQLPMIVILQQQRAGDDVAYSGAFEQDCDLLLKLERHYDPNTNLEELHVITKAVRSGSKKNFITHCIQGLDFSLKALLPDNYSGSENKRAKKEITRGPTENPMAQPFPSLPPPQLPNIVRLRGV